jgi:hypothetical protein
MGLVTSWVYTSSPLLTPRMRHNEVTCPTRIKFHMVCLCRIDHLVLSNHRQSFHMCSDTICWSLTGPECQQAHRSVRTTLQADFMCFASRLYVLHKQTLCAMNLHMAFYYIILGHFIHFRFSKGKTLKVCKFQIWSPSSFINYLTNPEAKIPPVQRPCEST